MSTSYYCTKPPVSAVRVDEGPEHDLIHIWEAGAKAGTLTVARGRGLTVARMFFNLDESQAPFITWGMGGGKVGREDLLRLVENCCLMSEYGEIVWLADLRRTT
jgi:hypothetical protein